MQSNLLLAVGINIDGALDHDGIPPPSLDEQFAMVRGHFDYVEKTLHAGESLGTFLDASSKHDVALGALGVIFQPGVDEARGLEVIAQARSLSISIVNCQIRPPLGTDDVTALDRMGGLYLKMLEEADGRTLPCLEPHVDMWFEQFSRVQPLADWLSARGAPLYLTIDHSHLIYRIDNPEQLAAAGIGSIAQGRKLLWPASEENYYRHWQSLGLIAHAHARCVQINAPSNFGQMRHPEGLPGRGIQYPISTPSDDSEWEEQRCEAWKEAVMQMLRWRAQHLDSPLRRISCEFIPYPDYGGGARYSIFEQNLACADWIRAAMVTVSIERQAT